jgi:hypothetical protein
MVLKRPYLLQAGVMHNRFGPKRNKFNYSVFYLASSVSKLSELQSSWIFGVNSPGLMSFYDRDHGERDGSDVGKWVCGVFSDHGVEVSKENVLLVCLPRVLGYVFNPVSFWYALDPAEFSIRAVLCEVSNTFGEHHWYICVPPDGEPLGKKDWIEGKKLFHVSPFLGREGTYRFRFQAAEGKIGAWIDYIDPDGQKILGTSVTGTLIPAVPKNLIKAFLQYPWVTLKVIALIHWQALKLVLKGIKYSTKPEQYRQKVSRIERVTKS